MMTMVRTNFRWWRRPGFYIVAVVLAVCLAPAAAPLIGNNFYVLVDGQAYRSAQPNGDEIRKYAEERGIATILNLRGASSGAPWYDDEVKTARQLGIEHIDFAMSARRELTPERVMELISIMKNAKKPLLIHCRAGADRTGLASALYMAFIAHKGEKTAESQLSLRFGHYALPVIGTEQMVLTWEAMESYFGFPKS